MGVSHDCNTLGPPDQAGISPIAKGKPLPKRDRAWECAGGRDWTPAGFENHFTLRMVIFLL